jgi:branched-chain amino acid transport system substrate-binding protein
MARGVGAVIVAAVLASAASAAPAADPGVTSTSILIGGTTSTGSALARGADAYFKWINARGGVNGRRIVYRYLDDSGDPGTTLAEVQRLVEKDDAFAIFNVPGTNNNLAIRDYLNSREVPQLFAASGLTALGADYREYPYTIGYPPTYRAEGSVYGRYLASTRPRSRIAVLYQDDDYGKDLLSGLRRGLGASVRDIVKTVGYEPSEPTLEAEVAELRSSGADVFMVFCPGKFALQALAGAKRLGWRPQIFLNQVAAAPSIARAAASGAISVAFGKDPTDPAWSGDPGLLLFQRVMKANGLGPSLGNAGTVAGMASAYTLVDALKLAGRNLTRQTLLKATANVNEADNPFLLPGIVVRTGPNDRFPVEQMQLERWNGKRWIRFGGLVTARS